MTHRTLSLVDGTFEDAVAALADHYAERCGAPAKAAADKAAAGGAPTLLSSIGDTVAKTPQWLSSLGDTVIGDPVARNVLLGTAAGGVAGAGSFAASKQKRDRKSLWRNMAAGALAGGTLGGGIGMAQKSFTGSAKPDVGVFVDPKTGQKMHVDPKVLAAKPELLNEIQRLSDPGSLLDQGVYGALGSAGSFLYNNLPISSVALPALGLRDLYNNSRWLPTTFTSMFGGAKNRRGTFDLTQAADVANLHRRVDVAALNKGLSALQADASSPFAREAPVMKKILAHSEANTILRAAQGDSAAIQRLKDLGHYKQFFGSKTGLLGSKVRADVDPKLTEMYTKSVDKLKEHLKTLKDLTRQAGRMKPGDPGEAALNAALKDARTEGGRLLGEVRKARRLVKPKLQPVHLHGSLLDQAAARGLEASAAGIPSPVYQANPWTGKIGPRAEGAWQGARRARRLGVMLGLPAAEYLGRMVMDQTSRERSLRERLQELAKPVND